MSSHTASITVSLTAADGHRFNAYVAQPAGTPRGALVVVQEIFGVNPHIRSVADGYAADGYLAIAPALFDRTERGIELGYSAADVTRGRSLKDASGNAKPLLDIAAALAHVQHAGRTGIVGYCWGGLLSWLAACELSGLAASVPYYGGGVPGQAALKPRCPVTAHFGERDSLIPIDTVQAFRKAQPAITVHTYAADHGFNCDQRGSFDATSAALARTRTLAFLREHVG
ncbi:MAG: carboxymethylenebutenolidase [Methylibium sp. NZG]|nr:MAG: carboxymethylenebutenolidase [Methylibium sp. NZG]